MIKDQQVRLLMKLVNKEQRLQMAAHKGGNRTQLKRCVVGSGPADVQVIDAVPLGKRSSTSEQIWGPTSAINLS